MRSPLRRSDLRVRAFGRRGDDGFTIVETLVAMGIATAVFLALAGAAMTGLRGSFISQQNQQAGDVLTQTVEQLRDMTYGGNGLEISSADPALASDGALTACASPSGYCYDPGLGSGPEALSVGATGQITNHQQTVTTNKYTYTVDIYVTRPGAAATPGDSYGADYERITVVARWSSYGKVHTRKTSTLVTYTLRGLPLPRFKFTPSGPTTITTNPFGEVKFGLKLQNLGARDCWNITSSDSSFSFYLDSGDGVYTPGAEAALAACAGAGSTLLEPTAQTLVWAVKDLTGNPGPYTQNVTFTATSWAQPSAATASQSVTDTYSVTNTVVTSSPAPTPTSPSPTPTTTAAPTTCDPFSSASTSPSQPKNYTAIGYFLHNLYPNSADTTAQSVLGFDLNQPTSNWLYDYGTDLLAATPGRLVQPGGSGYTESNVARVVDWRLQVNQTFVSGTAAFKLSAAPANGDPNAHGRFTVYLNVISPTGVVTNLSSATFDASTWGCTGFRRWGVPLTLPTDQKLATNSWIDVRVEVTGPNPMLVAYDTTSFKASLAIPER